MCLSDNDLVVHEHWRIVDKWWTDDPIDWLYRDVTLDGRRIVQRRRNNSEDNWEEYNPKE